MNMNMSIVLVSMLLYLAIDSYITTPTKSALILKYSINILINLIIGIINYFEHDWVFFSINIGCIILVLTTIIKLMKE